MRYSHIVIPGVFAEMLEGIESTIENLPSKSDQASGKSSNVKTTWYGGGYVSHIEDSTFYYFNRANNKNFGYNISSIEALRLEVFTRHGYYDNRKECDHFWQDSSDKKLIGIINMNDPYDPQKDGGEIILSDTRGHKMQVDNVFYKKKGSFLIFNPFTAYKITSVNLESLRFLYSFCVGPKWQ